MHVLIEYHDANMTGHHFNIFIPMCALLHLCWLPQKLKMALNLSEREVADASVLVVKNSSIVLEVMEVLEERLVVALERMAIATETLVAAEETFLEAMLRHIS